MSRTDPTGLDQLAAGCITLLIGVTALYLALRLIEAMWVGLLILLAVGGLATLAVVVLRNRWQSW